MTWEISILTVQKRKGFCMLMLKEWHTAETRVCRVVVLEEEIPDISSRYPVKFLTEEQSSQLHGIEKSFGYLLKDKPGSTSLTEIAINTGDPFQFCPYRIPAALLNPLRLSLNPLMEEGIIDPLHSPWSCPMIPVKKKDGSIRICIDFRCLNA